MSQSNRFVSDVVAAVCGHWPDVLQSLGIEVPPRRKHGPCPVCGGDDRFRLDDKAGRGTWICSQCDKPSGDGLDLVCRVTGLDVKAAALLVAPLVGMTAEGLDPLERARIHQQQQARADAQRKEAEQQRKEAASRAAAVMADTRQGVSAYLERKGLGGPLCDVLQASHYEAGENFPVGSLSVPLTNEAGELVNVQLINDDGHKRYLTGGQKADAYHRIYGGPLVAVVEGYATGLSVHLAAGATVYCAMDCGNLPAVAAIARRQHPEADMLLCGDNDATTDGNPGKAKAEQAAAAVGARVALPPEAGDWNDYHQAHGTIATREAIMAARTAPPTDTPKDNPKTANQEGGPWTAEKSRAERAPNAEGGSPWQATKDAASAPATASGNDDPCHGIPDGFELTGDRLLALMMVGRGDNLRQEWQPISSPVRVLADTSNEQGREWGRLLEWCDRKGRVCQWAMPMEALASRGGEDVIKALLSGGLPFVDFGNKRKFIDYLMGCETGRQVACVGRTGWYGGVYVLPGEAIGPDADGVILQSAGYAANDFSERGTLADWQREISALAVGNSRLCFALSLAFAAPLLSLVGMEGGGFHLKGDSTDGKSTITKAAASVYGAAGFGHTWRATGNAIEGIASRRNDALLCLDEIGEVDGREAGQVAYMLANGQGKGRSKQDGELRERKTWRLLFLSNGELSLEDHAASAGQRTQAGMEVRTIQIPSHTGHYGAFEQLHGMADGRTFADTLKASTEHHHGTAFRTYANALANDPDGHGKRLRAEIKRLADDLTPEGAGNQVGRAINRFALVAAAGELASQLGVTGWPAGEATRAVRVCLLAWLDGRGHVGNQEDAATLGQVRAFVAAHQFSRLADWYDHGHRPANIVGFRRVEKEGVSFYIQPTGWLEITKGRDPKRAAQLCYEAGYLSPSNDGKRLQRQARLPGMSNPVWVYLLTERVLADEADGQECE